MKIVVQRVSKSNVEINGRIYSEINAGLLILLGIQTGDTEKEADYLSKKIIDLRIFSDKNDKMNLSIKDINGEVLVISQFTLCTEEKSGNRPSFTGAEKPEIASKLYDLFLEKCCNYYVPGKIKSGIFAANMKVALIHAGPVTIILEKNF